MRTQEEILEKIKEVVDKDWMGTIRSDLVNFLDFENAKEFLKEGVTEAEWNGDKISNTVESIKEKMRDYLSFAFEKAEGERGISAGRSMDHYYAWIWMLGEEERFGDVREYSSYGIPHLNEIKSYLEA